MMRPGAGALNQSLKRFKFGVVYAKERQVLDDEFFSNGLNPNPHRQRTWTRAP